LVWLLVLGGTLLAGCSTDSSGGPDLAQNERLVKSADYGTDWPWIVSEGVLRCEFPYVVTFTTSEGTTYAVNGPARERATARGWLNELDSIRADDPLRPRAKIGLHPLTDAGQAICDSLSR
jgi:hypothetical protein